jgi:hypothetical protein
MSHIQCLIIDSISHEWDGVGGCLDIHAKLGGKFQDWAKVSPMHNKFIQAILQFPSHVLVTGRSKTDYSMDQNSQGGKAKVTKQGLKTVTREGFDYEMTLAFQIQHEGHYAIIDKDRTNLFNNNEPFLITEETGQKVKSWNDSGAKVVKKDQARKIENDDTAIMKDNLLQEIKIQFKNCTEGYSTEEQKDFAKTHLGISSFRELPLLDSLKLKEKLHMLLACQDLPEITDPNIPF